MLLLVLVLKFLSTILKSYHDSSYHIVLRKLVRRYPAISKHILLSVKTALLESEINTENNLSEVYGCISTLAKDLTWNT